MHISRVYLLCNVSFSILEDSFWRAKISDSVFYVSWARDLHIYIYTNVFSIYIYMYAYPSTMLKHKGDASLMQTVGSLMFSSGGTAQGPS